MPAAAKMYRIQAFATLTGVTVRTLHHYDRLGLLVARRHAGARGDRPGYRLYDASDLARLEQIVALRYLGFPLKQIAILLVAPRLSLSQALRLQQNLLQAKRGRLERALEVIATALRQRRPDANLLSSITKEILMASDNHSWTDKYYTEAAKVKINTRQPAFTPEMQVEVSQQWAQLVEQVRAALGEDPACPAVQALASRWRKLIEAFTQSDPEITSGLKKVWAARSHWPADLSVQTAAFTPEVMQFMNRALQAQSEPQRD
ncbi:MAG: MerR family transcriptional regulator [Terriglobales bacterium]